MAAEDDVKPLEIPPCPPRGVKCDECPHNEWCYEHIDHPEA